MDQIRSRIAGPSGFAAVVIAIIFAVFEVQGWNRPALIAAAFVVILAIMVAGALAMAMIDVMKAVRLHLEHRATSAAWVSSEAPGLLDYEADGIRASKRYTKELTQLTKDTRSLGAELSKHSKRMTDLKNRRASGIQKQRVGDKAAKSIERSAVYIEKRAALFEALVRDIARNYEGLIAATTIETDEDKASAQSLLNALRGNGAATDLALEGAVSYRNSVRSVEGQNLSRTIRIASKRLGDGLDATLRNLRQFQSQSQRLETLLDRKLRGSS